MSAPISPALVWAIMKPNSEKTREDLYMVADWMLSGSRHSSLGDLYREHIRNTAAEMRRVARTVRATAVNFRGREHEESILKRHAADLEGFANVLEGIK